MSWQWSLAEQTFTGSVTCLFMDIFRTVADRLGHSSPPFTMSVDVHGVSESRRRAAEIANGLLTSSMASVR